LANFFLLRTLRHEQLKSHWQGILFLMNRTMWFRITSIMADRICHVSWSLTCSKETVITAGRTSYIIQKNWL